VSARRRANLAAHNADAAAAGRPFAVAFSVGVAELEADDGLDSLLARGDAALYALKLARGA
jgi:PleD family two-component response regulator